MQPQTREARLPQTEDPVQASGSTLSLARGDVVTMTVFGRPELTGTRYVSDQGQINAPLMGPIDVLGLSPTGAAKRIEMAYREGQYLIDPQVNLVMAAVRSQQISVLGEVGNPGRYPIETRTTVLDALAQAGGISQLGAQRVFILRRGPDGGEIPERLEVDLTAVLQTGVGRVAELRAGDTLIVPRAKLFYIYGQVNAPSSYVLRDGLTIIEAISMAGGLTQLGSVRRIEVKRRDAEGRVESYDVDVDDPVLAEDVINVKERLF